MFLQIADTNNNFAIINTDNIVSIRKYSNNDFYIDFTGGMTLAVTEYWFNFISNKINIIKGNKND